MPWAGGEVSLARHTWKFVNSCFNRAPSMAIYAERPLVLQ